MKEDNTAYQAKYEGFDINKLAKAMQKTKEKHSQAKDKASEIWHEHDYLRMIAIPKMLESMNISSCKVKGVGTIGTRADASCKTLNSDDLAEWLKTNDLGDIVKSAVNGSTLKAVMKQRLKDGESLPDSNIVSFEPFEFAVITK